MNILEAPNETIKKIHRIANTDKLAPVDLTKGYKVGVDLGTSSIVIVVLNHLDEPAFCAFKYANVIRDGLIVDYQKSVEIVTKLKEEAEAALGFELEAASSAIPPGTIGHNKKIVANVVESAGFLADKIVDEPTAAATFLQIDQGAIIDVGGGTTGISVFQKGKVVYTMDEPTGGTHMTLVIAGYHKITVEEAESLKRDSSQERENFVICRPVIHRMAEICRSTLKKYPAKPMIVVGGASYFKEFEAEFGSYLEVEVLKPLFPQYVTPIGIALSSDLIEFD